MFWLAVEARREEAKTKGRTKIERSEREARQQRLLLRITHGAMVPCHDYLICKKGLRKEKKGFKEFIKSKLFSTSGFRLFLRECYLSKAITLVFVRYQTSRWEPLLKTVYLSA